MGTSVSEGKYRSFELASAIRANSNCRVEPLIEDAKVIYQYIFENTKEPDQNK